MSACASAAPTYLDELDLSLLSAELSHVETSAVSVSEGQRSILYQLGRATGPTVVLLPPYGMTFLLVLRLARLLGERYRVIIWESRGCPNADIAVRIEDLCLEAQSREFAALVRNRAPDGFHFVGWCQAAQLAVHAIATQGVRPRTMSWIAPAGFDYAVVTSEFERCALPIYLEIHRSGAAQAEKLARILDKYRNVPLVEQIAAEKLTMLHLASPEQTCTFAAYMQLYQANKQIAARLLPDALRVVPTQTLHCKDDTYSHFSESVQLSRKHGVELHLIESGGHLQVFNSPETIVHMIGRLIARRESAPVLLEPSTNS